MHYSQTTIPTEDREWFVRENAVAEVARLEDKIVRMRKAINSLISTAKGRRREIERLQDEIAKLKS